MRIVPLKHVVSLNERALPESTDPELPIRYLDIGSVGTGVLISPPVPFTFSEAPSRARRLVTRGDTILSTVRTYLRAVWPVSGEVDDLVVSTGFAVLSPGPGVEPRFLGWLAQSAPFVDEIVARSVGVSYPAINPSEIGELRISLPEPVQQRAIADYLDLRTTPIDALVAKRARLVDQLEARIDGMVMNCIGEHGLGGGARPAVEMRRLLSRRRVPATSGQVVTAFRDGQVTARVLRRAEGYTEAWREDAVLQVVRAGDVVVHGLDGFAGAIGTCEASGVCSPVYHVLSPSDGGDSDFYGRMLRVLAVEGYLGLFATSTRERAVDFRNWDLFGRIPIPAVSVDRQRDIGRRIRALRPFKVAVERSHRLLDERRHALITAAVMGELEIPGVA